MRAATADPMRINGMPALTRRHSRILQRPLASPREGVMLHYDDSSRDDWAVAWFSDPQCTNGYTWLVLDDGRVVELADPALRTPHAGACKTPNANSHFYGVSAATNGVTLATPAQVQSIIRICAALFRHHDWPRDEVEHRIVGHDAQAIWTPENTGAAGIDESQGKALWGQTGRKTDPTGRRSDRRPIIDIPSVRLAVYESIEAKERDNAVR
jgi:N-acetyl-anhydromuramyl-L-alanine amidase AmpD